MRGALRFGAAMLLCLGGGAAASPVKSAPPRRIVSLNLCADQLLLELADRDQIAGLTQNARDPEMSVEAGRVGDLRVLGSSAEQILAIDPDLVIGMPVPRTGAMAALGDRHYRALDLQPDNDLAAIVANIRAVARATGHPGRGEAMIARMNAALARVGRPGRGRIAAYYQRRGFLTGTGTLVDELMTRLGLVNLATRLGKPALSQLSLEELIAAGPDYLIVESSTDRIADQGTEMLHHPAIRAIPRLKLPQAWIICGGPAYVAAAQSLAQQIGSR